MHPYHQSEATLSPPIPPRGKTQAATPTVRAIRGALLSLTFKQTPYWRGKKINESQTGVPQSEFPRNTSPPGLLPEDAGSAGKEVLKKHSAPWRFGVAN